MIDPKMNDAATTTEVTVTEEGEPRRLVVEVPTDLKAGMPKIRSGSDCLVCTCDGGGCCSAC